MKLNMRSHAVWLRYAVHMRWVVLLGAALLLMDRLQNQWVLGALGAFAASNVGLLMYLKARPDQEERASKLAGAVRLVDGLLLTGLGVLPILHGDRLWLLGVPILLAEAMTSPQRSRMYVLAGSMMLVQTLVEWRLGSKLPVLLGSVAILAGSGLTGLLLEGFGAKEDRLSLRDKRLAAVLECGSAFAATRDLRATIVHTLKAAVTETGASCGYVMLAEDDGRGDLVTEAAYSIEGEFKFPERLEFGTGLSGYVAKMGQPVAVADDSEDHKGYDGVTAGVHSAICVPLATRGASSVGKTSEEQILGVMTFLSTKKGHSFESDDVDLLRTLASLIAVAVSNSRLEERQHATFVRTMESLATALEARDEYTQGHSQRVCEVSILLGEKMGFSPDAIEELRIGTVLHDIGKIGVPDAILNKRARLTDEEFQLMKLHPVIGYEICKPLVLSEGVLMLIRNHHERLDGTGYPDGLRGGELPLSLRIVCVADAFDAMSSTRPYRGVMAMSDVLAELSRGAGTQFDPVVVEHLKELIHSDRMNELYHRNFEEQERKAA